MPPIDVGGALRKTETWCSVPNSQLPWSIGAFSPGSYTEMAVIWYGTAGQNPKPFG